MKNYRKMNNIFGWITFVIASTVFLLTIEPTVSWWDPGEFISTTYKLQIGHPPGTPTMQLIGRIFSLFALGDVTKVAMMVNAMSAICSGLAVLFLFWTITIFARKIVAPKEEEMTTWKMWSIISAGLVGALTFTFTDSFWFSAVEGEVYAMSAMFTAIVVWAIFKWEEVADEKHAARWLIFIAFMIGLAVGVHLLNLLTIPALGLVIYFKKFKTSKLGIFLTLVISTIVLAFVMYFVIPWIPELADRFELLFVNSFGLPFNSGTIFYFVVLIGLIIWGLYYTQKKAKPLINTIILCFVFLLVGYSTFVMLVIRSNADTPINENSPKDIVSLVAMLNREQYGTWPLLYGQYYNAPIIDYEDGNPIYEKDTVSKKYVIIDDRKGTIPVYDPRFTTLFPRMWSNERRGSADYFKRWGGGEGVPITITDQDGKTQTLNKPTFGENLKFFFSYQVGWMYLRYFMWNFAGRQNDVQGFGGAEDGNWISGIPFIDKWRLGHDQTNLPDSKKNWSRNTYFMLPLLLGLLGLFYQAKKEYKGALVITLLFLLTGLAIVIYLNQKPFEPRERDYSYCGSTYAFAIWVGLGVLYLIDLLNKKLKENLSVIIVTILTLVLIPGIMAQQNWDDHDRSDKYSCRDFAANYLNSCGKDGILITNGDNDTFPLWYDQEVEGIRTDVRVVNNMLASGAWYINQMYRKTYDSDPLPFTLSKEQYRPGTNDIIPFYDIGLKGYVELKDLIGFIKSDDPRTFLQLQNGDKIKFFPSKKVKITVDSATCVKYGIVPKYLQGKMVDSVCWTIKTNQLYKNDLMLLDIVATNDWKRPIYFAAPSSVSHFFNVDSFCLVQGWVYKFMPVKANKADYIPGMGGVDPLTSYDILMNKCKWGNLNDPNVYMDPESFNNLLRPKTNFMRVGQALVDMGRKKQAIEMLDTYLKYFPDWKVPYDMYMIPYAEIYYRAGETDKANKLVKRVVEVYSQNVDYYFSYDPKTRQAFDQDIQTALGMIKRCSMVATDHKQKDLSTEIDTVFSMKLRLYQ
ncbi:MAG: DUF2723 domain-containing protein [bacterium]